MAYQEFAKNRQSSPPDPRSVPERGDCAATDRLGAVQIDLVPSRIDRGARRIDSDGQSIDRDRQRMDRDSQQIDCEIQWIDRVRDGSTSMRHGSTAIRNRSTSMCSASTATGNDGTALENFVHRLFSKVDSCIFDFDGLSAFLRGTLYAQGYGSRETVPHPPDPLLQSRRGGTTGEDVGGLWTKCYGGG